MLTIIVNCINNNGDCWIRADTRKAEVEELLPNDFSWPEYDKWKDEFERIGYSSYAWEKMTKKGNGNPNDWIYCK